jgi:dihydroorotate dehydrogenase
MQERQALAELLTRVMGARDEAAMGGRKAPVFLKIAPDLTDAELGDVAAEVLEQKLEGVIVSNTTLARANLSGSPHSGETGGLSGRPLFERSTSVLARMRKLLGPEVALIGVGGVDSTETAIEKIRAGADLVQLYTGMIFGGPALPGRIVNGLAAFCEREKITSIGELRDSGVERWAKKPVS